MVVLTFNHSTGEVEAGDLCEFQNNQSYTEKPCPKNPIYVYKSFWNFKSYTYICVPGTCTLLPQRQEDDIRVSGARVTGMSSWCGSWWLNPSLCKSRKCALVPPLPVHSLTSALWSHEKRTPLLIPEDRISIYFLAKHDYFFFKY